MTVAPTGVRVGAARWAGASGRAWWVVGMYLVARVGTIVVLAVADGGFTGGGWSRVVHDLGTWDSAFYRRIAAGGYPDHVPRGAHGEALPNGLAFFPLLPALARLVAGTQGAAWIVPVSGLSLAMGAAATVLLHALVRARLGAGPALAAALTFAAYPTSLVLAAPYAESLAATLLFAALLLLDRQRYLAAVAPVVLLGLARPLSLPLLAVVLVMVARPGQQPATRRLAVLAAAVVAVVAWPVAAWMHTGDPLAYLASEEAWSRGAGPSVLMPWLGWPQLLGALGLCALAAGAWSVGRGLGRPARAWLAVYPLYLLLVAVPGTSVWRLLIVAVPFAAAAMWARLPPFVSRGPWRALLLAGGFVVGSIALQAWWVTQVWLQHSGHQP